MTELSAPTGARLGTDEYSATILKALSTIMPVLLVLIYNTCLKIIVPSVFKTSLERSIPKRSISKHSSCDLSLTKSWRPIILLSLPEKVIEKLIIGRINHQMERNDWLSNNQYGFTTGRSTVVTSFIHQTYDSNRHGAIDTLDISVAIEHSTWPAIIATLVDHQVSDKLLAIVLQGSFRNSYIEIGYHGPPSM